MLQLRQLFAPGPEQDVHIGLQGTQAPVASWNLSDVHDVEPGIGRQAPDKMSSLYPVLQLHLFNPVVSSVRSLIAAHVSQSISDGPWHVTQRLLHWLHTGGLAVKFRNENWSQMQFPYGTVPTEVWLRIDPGGQVAHWDGFGPTQEMQDGEQGLQEPVESA